jgi:hypothetical protein
MISNALRGLAYAAFIIPVNMNHANSGTFALGLLGLIASFWIIGKTTGKSRFQAAKKRRDFVKEELEDTSAGEIKAGFHTQK